MNEKKETNDRNDQESGEVQKKMIDEEPSNLTGDYSNVLILLLLYILQGDRLNVIV